MPRLVDADILAESTCYGICQECDEMHKGNNVTTNCSEIRLRFLRLINDAPTVDAVEVVRCKDCKHYRHDDVFHRWYCSIGMTKRATSKDDYCSWGERR